MNGNRQQIEFSVQRRLRNGPVTPPVTNRVKNIAICLLDLELQNYPSYFCLFRLWIHLILSLKR